MVNEGPVEKILDLKNSVLKRLRKNGLAVDNETEVASPYFFASLNQSLYFIAFLIFVVL